MTPKPASDGPSVRRSVRSVSTSEPAPHPRRARGSLPTSVSCSSERRRSISIAATTISRATQSGMRNHRSWSWSTSAMPVCSARERARRSCSVHQAASSSRRRSKPCPTMSSIPREDDGGESAGGHRQPDWVGHGPVHGTSVCRGRGFRCADSGDEVAGRGDEHGAPHAECHDGVGAPVVAEDGQADEIDHR